MMGLHDTTWGAVELGSEGWAVFAGPRMLASHLTEDDARLIANAPIMEIALKRINARAMSMTDLGAEDTAWQDAQRINQLCEFFTAEGVK